MSLKFGIYLVEQRIISPEQFCGLVKIQQESTRSLASLSIAQNYLTMKQVSRILDEIKDDEGRFIEVAMGAGLLDRSDAVHLVKLQEQSGESIKNLAIECGLLTQRQSEVLFNHFQRYGARQIEIKRKPVASKPAAQTGPGMAIPSAQMPKSDVVPAPKQNTDAKPAPSPKFKQRPLIKVEEVQH